MFEKNLLAGEKILITGGGSGLGQAMAYRFAELGADLVVCGRRPEPLEETVGEIRKRHGRKAWALTCDIRDPASVEKLFDDIWKDGPLTGLVNNAAGNFISRTEDLSHRAVDAVLSIVLHGTTYVTLAAGKRWLAEKRKARVLNIVATYAWTGSAFVVPSAMAKAGVLALTRSLAVEWGGRGICSNAIAPGPFPTPGAWQRLAPDPRIADRIPTKNPLGRVGEPHELANLASYLMAPGASFVNGEVVTIDGGEWLKGAGEFNFLEMLSERDWESLKPPSKSKS